MQLLYIDETEKNEEYAELVFNMCQKAYQPIGGFNSLQSYKDVPKRIKLLKIVIDRDIDGNESIINAIDIGTDLKNRLSVINIVQFHKHYDIKHLNL